ncbi:unnamed protein product, partial [Brenthis ino]
MQIRSFWVSNPELGQKNGKVTKFSVAAPSCNLVVLTSCLREHVKAFALWYPYDTSNHPAYEITYIQQVSAILFAALLNVSKDTLESTTDRVSLMRPSTTLFLTRAQETEVQKRLRDCVIQHQNTLETAFLLQNTFSEPIFAQFNVSLVIICATAFQLVSQTGNFVRLMSMGTYLFNMIYQVFIYCYQGNQFSSESEEVAKAAYDMPWYSCSVRTRRSILIVMVRCRRVAKLTAGGFTTLSLTTFMAVRS